MFSSFPESAGVGGRIPHLNGDPFGRGFCVPASLPGGFHRIRRSFGRAPSLFRALVESHEQGIPASYQRPARCPLDLQSISSSRFFDSFRAKPVTVQAAPAKARTITPAWLMLFGANLFPERCDQPWRPTHTARRAPRRRAQLPGVLRTNKATLSNLRSPPPDGAPAHTAAGT